MPCMSSIRCLRVIGRLNVPRRGVSSEAPRTEIQSGDLLDTYRGLVSQGLIQYDEQQVRIIMQLRTLRRSLENYAPTPFLSPSLSLPAKSKVPSDSWWTVSNKTEQPCAERALVRVQSHAQALAELDTPKGMFLVGPAGVGKSMLLQLFYDSLPTPYKARKHYSQLALEIYRAVWEESRLRSTGAPDLRLPVQPMRWHRALRAQWKELLAGGSGFSATTTSRSAPAGSKMEPPIANAIANRLISHHWLLFFDEIQLLDVSSAGLLSDVLSWYWRMGGVIIGSGNKLPDDLYRGGVQRERLEPFVEALKIRCPVLVMRQENDWRRLKAQAAPMTSWFMKSSESDHQRFRQTVEEVVGQQQGGPSSLSIFGRRLEVPFSIEGVCRFALADLCEQELGPADYLTIASTYHTIILTDIPVFPLSAKNQARRFISLLDALYESRCRIIGLAAARPDDIFFPDAAADGGSVDSSASHDELMMAEAFSEGIQQAEEGFRPNFAAYDISANTRLPNSKVVLPMSDKPLSIFTGEEERFAFVRAVSRIHELSSLSVDHGAWMPLAPAARQWEGGSIPAAVERYTPPPLALEDQLFGAAFAAKTAYESPRQQRVTPPEIRSDHVWGAREDWGSRAGRWGQGAKAHRETEEKKG